MSGAKKFIATIETGKGAKPATTPGPLLRCLCFGETG